MKDYTPDYIKINKFREVGEQIRFLDLEKEEDIEKYYTLKRELTILAEGKANERYLDDKGNFTVGIGFNMNQISVKQE